MLRFCALILGGASLLVCAFAPSKDDLASQDSGALTVGFGEADITPKVGGDPVYMAGFGQNRKATKVHDPLLARAVVLRDGTQKIAIASVDLVGYFHPQVLAVRQRLPGFT